MNTIRSVCAAGIVACCGLASGGPTGYQTARLNGPTIVENAGWPGFETSSIITSARAESRDASALARRDANTPTLFPVADYGSLDYYLFRNIDFRLRNPGRTPPDYYFFYGNKYVRKFNNETRPLLMPAGQAWIDATAILLQQGIEDQIRESASNFAKLERKSSSFRSFAFGTHPDAYLEGGLTDLTIRDLLLVYLTPDVKDLLSDEAQQQAAETIDRLLDDWLARAMNEPGFLSGKLDEAVAAIGDPVVQRVLGRKLVELAIYLFLEGR